MFGDLQLYILRIYIIFDDVILDNPNEILAEELVP